MSYQENPIDDTIRQLISDFQNGADIIALQANVQTRYEDAVNADANLQNLLEVTIPNAVSEWEIQQQQLAEQKAQEAANQVAQQDQTEQQIQQPNPPITDQPVQQPEVTQPDQTQVQIPQKLNKRHGLCDGNHEYQTGTKRTVRRTGICIPGV